MRQRIKKKNQEKIHERDGVGHYTAGLGGVGTESAGRGPLGKDSLGRGVSAQPDGVQGAQPAEIWGERNSEDRSLEARAHPAG